MTGGTISLDAASGRTWDALVIGAGPAGAVAARGLALGGARVLLVEKKAFPRAKVCGACLNGRALAGLGSLADGLGAVELGEFRVTSRGRSLRVDLPGGKAVSRARLDEALAAAAVAAGAEFLTETGATVEPSSAPVRRVRLDRRGVSATAEARVVVVAAGLGNACLDREPAFETSVAPESRLGAGCLVGEFPDAYRAGTVFMAVGRGGYVGLVRVEGGRLNVAAALDRAWLKEWGTPARASAALLVEAGLPAVEALADADWLGTVALTRRTRPLAGPGLFVLGDAAGYVEPFTGEGMGWAVDAGRAVGPLALRAVEAGSSGRGAALAREWPRAYARLVGRRQSLCRGLSAVARRPWASRAALGLASSAPAVPGWIARRVAHGMANR